MDRSDHSQLPAEKTLPLASAGRLQGRQQLVFHGLPQIGAWRQVKHDPLDFNQRSGVLARLETRRSFQRPIQSGQLGRVFERRGRNRGQRTTTHTVM